MPTADVKERGPWLDILKRKHECSFPYSPPIQIEIESEGRSIRALIPDVLVKPRRLELRAVVPGDDLLLLIGRHTLEDGDNPYECGIAMIARRGEDGTYVVHVWHELFPHALTALGLSDRRIEFRMINPPPDEEED